MRHERDIEIIRENWYQEITTTELEMVKTVLNDLPPVPVDVVHIFGRAHGDQDKPLALGAELYHRGIAKNIIIPGSDGQKYSKDAPQRYEKGEGKYETMMGKEGWIKILGIKHDVNIDNIYCTEPPFNTKDDADTLLKACKKYGWKTAAVVTQPHQLPRAILSVVASMRTQNYWLPVYSISTENINWNEVVPGSQGMEIKPRYLDVKPESERIAKYAPRDVALPEEYLDYIRKRNAGLI